MANLPPGRYAYRFGGFSMHPDEEHPFAVVGLGLITVQDGGGIEGFHQATSTVLADFDAKPTIRRYDVVGHVAPMEAEMHKASITFTSPEQIMEGDLVLTPAGPDRFWLISQKAKILPGGRAADEVISGELIRLGPAA